MERMFLHVCRLLVLVGCLKESVGLRRQLLVENVQTGASLNGLGCSLEHLPTARGSDFNRQANTCAALSGSWFSNPTSEPSHDYFKLKLFEPVFEHTLEKMFDLPSYFGVGASVIITLQTGIVDVGNFGLDFTTPSQTPIAMFVNVRQEENVLLFNTHNGAWGLEERHTNPFTTSNRIFKLEFVLTETHFELYIDGTYFASYAHRLNLYYYQSIRYISDHITINRIQLTYP